MCTSVLALRLPIAGVVGEATGIGVAGATVDATVVGAEVEVEASALSINTGAIVLKTVAGGGVVPNDSGNANNGFTSAHSWQ